MPGSSVPCCLWPCCASAPWTPRDWAIPDGVAQLLLELRIESAHLRTPPPAPHTHPVTFRWASLSCPEVGLGTHGNLLVSFPTMLPPKHPDSECLVCAPLGHRLEPQGPFSSHILPPPLSLGRSTVPGSKAVRYQPKVRKRGLFILSESV